MTQTCVLSHVQNRPGCARIGDGLTGATALSTIPSTHVDFLLHHVPYPAIQHALHRTRSKGLSQSIQVELPACNLGSEAYPLATDNDACSWSLDPAIAPCARRAFLPHHARDLRFPHILLRKIKLNRESLSYSRSKSTTSLTHRLGLPESANELASFGAVGLLLAGNAYAAHRSSCLQSNGEVKIWQANALTSPAHLRDGRFHTLLTLTFTHNRRSDLLVNIGGIVRVVDAASFVRAYCASGVASALAAVAVQLHESLEQVSGRQVQ
jgi:hypothetical protein